MAECIECGEYTKYKGGLCYKCYKKQNPSSNEDEQNNEDETKGLSNKERDFRYGMIKGRIAETLIQELFLSLVSCQDDIVG